MLLCRFHRNRFLTLTIIFLAAGSLLLSSFLSLSITAKAQLEARVRRGRPERGRPEGTFEDLAVVRRRPNGPARAIDAEPSTIRSPKNPLEQRNGRKVDDPWPTQLGANLNERPNRAKVANDQFSKVQDGGRNANRPPPTRSHHAARLSPPPVSDDTYVQDFFQAALGRAPSPAELTYWTDTFRAAYANGQGSVANSAHEMGKTLFESAEYAVRNSDEGTAPGGCDGNPNHHCVYVNHLYNAYLRRPPDQPSWNAWASVVPTYGRVEVRRGFDESTEFLNLMATVTPNGSASSAASSLRRQELSRRINPRSGLVGRSADWSLPILSLPGRGVDLGLTLSYSSQVWTRSGPYIYFDEDNGFPSPGFRLGFPTIQEKYFDAKVGRNVYVVVTSAGGRIELRQIGTSNTYEAGDSSYLQLTDTGGVVSVRSSDGTQFSYGWYNREYHCTQIKDRNGNYITVNYDALGLITNISDTLNRNIIFEYDDQKNLLRIKQQRSAGWFEWATFSWDTKTIQPNYSGMSGIANGTQIPVLYTVGLPDGSYYRFKYSAANSGQVSKRQIVERNAQV